MMSQAPIFSIEEFSVYDGPGMRAAVFLKGCPLRCEWCHNPEGQSPEPQIVKATNGCTGCGACLAAGAGVLTEKSVGACPNRLLRVCGSSYTPERLIRRLEPLLPMLNEAGGGVTFSGGEPLAHPVFLYDCLCLLEGRTHRAVQTSGFCCADDFDLILRAADLFLYDLKLLDPAEHFQYTGRDNAPIIRNYRALRRSGKSFITRIPLIPGVTDTEKGLTAAALFLRENGVDSVELLPYNKLAGAKYASIGRSYAPSFDENAAPQARKDLFRSFGIEPKVLWGDRYD